MELPGYGTESSVKGGDSMVVSKTTDDEEACKGIRVYTLCGVSGCCPTVEVNHDIKEIVLKDDFGGVVKLTIDEWHSAMEQVKI
jgi:hypothetical protein